MPLALYALAISAFAIGTTEFVIMGLLPEVAADLDVSIPGAGLLVTGYAAGVVAGAPLLTAATARLPRKRVLLGLMTLFVLGNVMAALLPTYAGVMVARVLTAFAHGAFFGIASVLAVQLVPRERQAAAIALMFTGATVANVMGVPAGTWLGQALGWRATFWAVAAIGVIAVVGTALLVPSIGRAGAASLRRELSVMRRGQVQLALAMTVLGYGGVFTAFTYIAPLLTDVTDLPASAVSPVLVLFGAGLVVGNLLGGRLTDRYGTIPSLLGILAALALVLASLTVTSESAAAMLVTVFLFGATAFGTVPGLQLRIVEQAEGAPTVASAFNIAAFNLGNAGGALLGGLVIDSSLGLRAVGWVGALVTLAGLGLTALAGWRDRRAAAGHPAPVT
jgi:MFS transporter, DHA1 family, inner membrane transport protein